MNGLQDGGFAQAALGLWQLSQLGFPQSQVYWLRVPPSQGQRPMP